MTVIVPACDAARYLSATIASLVAQTFTGFEAIVVDDASTDATPEVLSACTDPRIRVVRNERRLGPAGSRNRALDMARGRYVAFLDADDVARPIRLARQLDVLSRRRDVGLIAACAAVADEHGSPTGAVWGRPGDADDVAATMLFANGLVTSTVVVERALIGDERFDPSLGVGSDYDMWLRLVERGRAVCLADVLVDYRRNPAGRTEARRDATGACLERIVRAALARFGIAATDDEVRIHRALGSGGVETTPAFLGAADRWLRRLRATNAAGGRYAAARFDQELRARWLDACEALARAGCWRAWAYAARSPFTRAALRDRNEARRVASLPAGMIRGVVRRRWPSAGASVRAASRIASRALVRS